MRAAGEGGDRMGWLAGVIDSADISLSKLQEIVKVREAWHAVVHGATWTVDTAEQLNNNNNVLEIKSIYSKNMKSKTGRISTKCSDHCGGWGRKWAGLG